MENDKKKHTYMVVRRNAYELAEEIERHLNDGWVCQGGPFTYQENDRLFFGQLIIMNSI